ncbi:lipoprotein [Pseudomonas sp. M47T1]|nr:lipoprotein [Pseudomonas sp. M47T1]
MLRLLLVALMLASVTACTSRKIITPDRTVPAGVTASKEQVKQAVLSTLAARKWTVESVDSDVIHAQVNVRAKYTAKVDIAYAAGHYRISYRDSQDLGYKDGKINRNYNRWVILLDRSILRKLQGDASDAQDEHDLAELQGKAQ